MVCCAALHPAALLQHCLAAMGWKVIIVDESHQVGMCTTFLLGQCSYGIVVLLVMVCWELRASGLGGGWV